MEKAKRIITSLLLIVVFGGLIFLIGRELLSPGWTDWLKQRTSVSSDHTAPDTIKAFPFTQVFVGLGVALFGFLVLDRWRRVEADLSDLRKTAEKTAKEAEERLDRKIAQYLEDKTRKLDAMDNKVSKLLEDHPWIIGLTQNDFIPNIPSCRIVLTTARELHAREKTALVYFYCARSLTSLEFAGCAEPSNDFWLFVH